MNDVPTRVLSEETGCFLIYFSMMIHIDISIDNTDNIATLSILISIYIIYILILILIMWQYASEQ